LDLSKILTKGIAMSSNMYGYKGTDSMPPCTRNLCWFLKSDPYQITAEELKVFKDAAPQDNFRKTNLGTASQYNTNFKYEGLFANN